MKKIFFIAVLLLTAGLAFTSCSNNGNKPQTEQLAKDEVYTCTMHNEIMSEHSGECPRCGMKLVKQKMTAEQQKMIKEGTYVKLKEQ